MDCNCVCGILKALTLLSVYSCIVRSFASEVRNLLLVSSATFHFEVFFTKNTTSQVSVDGFKVSVVRLREVSVLWEV